MLTNISQCSPRSELEAENMVDTIDDMFDYHPWNDDQKEAGAIVLEALKQALALICINVPPCADRSAAIRKLREVRMDCNSAITHKGKY